jgi:son of sevenless-like protein
MNGIVNTAPPGAMYVRALYDYEADDRTSLSFHEGDVIQVITRLESGWWDGVINGVRGWFPSNYCQIITSPDELPELEESGDAEQVDEENDDQEVYEEGYEDDEASDRDDADGALDATEGDRSRADFWIPQATPDGRLYYYNTMTGESSMELPLESPSSVTETGPRDRMNVSMPDRTRPPPEMIARGLTQEEEDESDVNSASELEGEAILNASRGSMVCSLWDLFSVLDGVGCLQLLSGYGSPSQSERRHLARSLYGLDERPVPWHKGTWRYLCERQPTCSANDCISYFIHQRCIQSPNRCNNPALLF